MKSLVKSCVIPGKSLVAVTPSAAGFRHWVWGRISARECRPDTPVREKRADDSGAIRTRGSGPTAKERDRSIDRSSSSARCGNGTLRDHRSRDTSSIQSSACCKPIPVRAAQADRMWLAFDLFWEGCFFCFSSRSRRRDSSKSAAS